MTVTDNDLIEKSNLNRQFLFRPHHIQVRMKGKSWFEYQRLKPKIQYKLCWATSWRRILIRRPGEQACYEFPILGMGCGSTKSN